MSDAEINLLAALVGAGMTSLLAVLTPKAAESVRERLAHARAGLPPAGKVQGEIEALIAAHPRISVSHAITAQHVAGLDVLTREERQHMTELAGALTVGFLKADEKAAPSGRMRLVPVLKAVPDEDPAPGPFAEPSHEDD